MDMYPTSARPDDPWQKKFLLFFLQHGLWIVWAFVELFDDDNGETYRSLILAIIITGAVFFAAGSALCHMLSLSVAWLVLLAALDYFIGGVRYYGLQEKWPS